MATYNGSPYIHEQIASILPQMEQGDELIVVDDHSEDNTKEVVEGFSESRMKFVQNERNFGIVRTFERALHLATGDVIFLSDQDDVWRDDKIRAVLDVFDADPLVSLVVSSVEGIDMSGSPLPRSVRDRSTFRGGVLRTLIKNSYQGCTMAFRKSVAEASLPFPAGIPMHDSWIGLVNSLIGKAHFLDLPLVRYRRHGQNATGIRRLTPYQRIAGRWSMCTNLIWRSRLLARRGVNGRSGSNSVISAG